MPDGPLFKIKRAASHFKMHSAVLIFALENYDAMQWLSEQDILSVLASFDVIAAVWYDPRTNKTVIEQVKGPELTESGMTMNAIIVRDEDEAVRWSELFAGTTTPRTKPRLRLAAENGELLDAVERPATVELSVD